MNFTCPKCSAKNQIDVIFYVKEYVCESCSSLINTKENKVLKNVHLPKTNVVLKVGQKGTLEGVDYIVTSIVVKRYGNYTFWREYTLKDSQGNYKFLSESDGHWVLLTLLEDPITDYHTYAEYKGKKYRWFETTPCSIDSATGFFEDGLNFSLATYKEFVNDVEMISKEEVSKKKEYFIGHHISKFKVKKGFQLSSLPNYIGKGIVQPFYINVNQALKILGVVGVMMCVYQLFAVMTRKNEVVFEQEILFTDVKDRELISNTFELSGPAAPLKIEAYSDVNNSWANLQLSLVNEENNENTYASRDIERYSGYEDGESWVEGSNSIDFNICGVKAGKYHFAISAEKENTIEPFSNLYSPDGKVYVSRDNVGEITVIETDRSFPHRFTSAVDIEKDTSDIAKLIKTSFRTSKIDSLFTEEGSKLSSSPDNKSIKIKATWLPVSFWNFTLFFVALIIIVIIIFVSRHQFRVSKWSNSANSPYPKST